MANLAQAMKEEMGRVAQREVRRQMSQPKKQQSQQRRDIAALKRRIAELERRVAHFENQEKKRLSGDQSPADAVMAALAGQSFQQAAQTGKGQSRPRKRASGPRFQARGLRTHRQKVGLSAEEYGKLAGVSGQSIYAWENERSRPRRKQVEALNEVRKLGKREVQRRLESNQQSPTPEQSSDGQ